MAQNSYHSDDKLLHFGFSLGFNAMDFGVTSSNGGVAADVSNLRPGFSVGIVSDLMLNRYLNLRFTPTLHFGERELTFKGLGSVIIPSSPVSIPFYLKYSAERYGDFRPYILGGGGAYFDLGRSNENPILLKTFDTFMEVGVGCDIYFSFFKLAPELKFGFGFNNMLTPWDSRDTGLLNPTDRQYSDALSKLKSRFISLTFNFE
ncbi:MAG: hypothetical protein AUK44_04030 [Porphyromonadaceae bacterium CG2_30_38_12]|nr:MAG: hypothetical protein AUK44_04030 [Porphyromonadaceae bacterium CG2_30_38_12]